MSSSPENIKVREKFLTSTLAETLSATDGTATDYFTATASYPKAFRVGECVVDADDKATLQVVLLWRDDISSAQDEIYVETLRIGGEWLINKISN